VFAIHAIEDEPPAGIEPIEWMLLSSVPTHSPEQALERLQWYARRWTIETWHRVLKSGCRIEARQFGTLERFVRRRHAAQAHARALVIVLPHPFCREVLHVREVVPVVLP
jgi:hypothetical protein